MGISTALAKAVKQMGGQSAMARTLAKRTGRPIRQGHVWQWIERGNALPPEIALHIEAETGISRKDLCPEFPWDLAKNKAVGQ